MVYFPSCSNAEIAHLLRVFTKLGEVQMKEVAPAARKQDACLSFAFVYPDRLEIFWMWQSTNELLTSAVSY
ncbi:unnamed protein product [Sphagnum jensenii]|uniref:Uncharacterized protein n=1 Tax=Sphagnum jensenii TaxID=128206 RepID=A0ABP0WB86_9BRYO